MQCATENFLAGTEALAEERRREILLAADCLDIRGNVYFVSNEGDDGNDGLSPERPWKSLPKVSNASLNNGDGVLFHRGDIFRGCVMAQSGVTYGAYGEGRKPKFYGWDHNLADPVLWEPADIAHNIWKLKEPILDCGTLVFNEGLAHSRKLIPSYIGGRFVCRDNKCREFDMVRDMSQNLDLVCIYSDRLTTQPSRGQDFSVPLIDQESFGALYLRCDAGNPGAVYRSIEALPGRSMFCVRDNANVTIDNLCLKYIGAHAVAACGHVVGLHVSNCEIGWIGGSIQHYLGTDPNYPQGGRGTVTRFGNGVEIYGGCEDYRVSNCWIYQVYDAAITHQVTTFGKTYTMSGIRYWNNLVENCVYSIEYFLEKTDGDTESFIEDCEIRGNILRCAGYGWGQQRHNVDTPAHLKGWSYENTARNFCIQGNIFDRSAYRMVHLVAKERESCPRMAGNTYIQHLGLPLGQYGANENGEPEIMTFDETAEEKISSIMGETDAKIYYLDM